MASRRARPPERRSPRQGPRRGGGKGAWRRDGRPMHSYGPSPTTPPVTTNAKVVIRTDVGIAHAQLAPGSVFPPDGATAGLAESGQGRRSGVAPYGADNR